MIAWKEIIMTIPVVNTIYENIPTTEICFVRENFDGSFTIVLNARMDHETLMRAYRHELMHLIYDDFDSDLSADEIEKERHKQ